MNYYTDENDLNKLNSISPQQPGNREKGDAGVLDIFVASIIKINKLAEICVQNSGKFVTYVLFMAVLVSFMSYLVPTASRIYSFGGFNKLFLEEFPKFTVNDGIVTADKKFEMRFSTGYLIIDTDIDAFTEKDLEATGVYIAISKKYIKLINYTNSDLPSNYTEIYSYPVGYILPSGLDNEKLASLSPVFYFSYIVVFFVQAVLAALKYLLLALLYAFFTRSTTAISKLSFTMKDSFHLAFYAETIGIILVNVNKAAGSIIPSFLMSAAGVVISIVVILNAIKPHLPDLDEFMSNQDKK